MLLHAGATGLLNVDLKIFTKIIATRIQQYIPSLIHQDKVGFVPTREDRDNTIRVLNLIHVVNKKKIPCIFLSTDAEKAFDRVDWKFMTAVLGHVGLDDRMLNWINSVYMDPTAQVRANGVLSDPFTIKMEPVRVALCPRSSSLCHWNPSCVLYAPTRT